MRPSVVLWLKRSELEHASLVPDVARWEFSRLRIRKVGRLDCWFCSMDLVDYLIKARHL